MTLDLILFGIVLVFGVLGFFSGFELQAMHLVVYLIAYLLCGVIGRPLGGVVAEQFGMQPLLGQTISTLSAFLVVYLLLSTAGWILIKRWHRFDDADVLGRRKIWDKALGAGLGSIKAFAVVFLLLCTSVLVESKYHRSLQGAGVGYNESFLVAMARDHNIMKGFSLPLVGDFDTLAKLSSDPEYRQKVAANKQVSQLLSHPKIQNLLRDKTIQQASQQNDFASLIANPHLNSILQDPEVRKLISEIDLSKIE